MLSVALGIALSLGGGLIAAPPSQAASGTGRTEFIARVVGAAQAAQRKFGVPASVSIAQAISASDWGGSEVARKANNFFDTPCSGTMTESQYASLADAQVGKPYVLGANGPTTFDCSSLVIWLNNQSGAYRMGDDTAAGMYNRSRAVSGSPKVGDMVFLRNNPARANGIGHMAVLTKRLPGGEWRIIEARGRAYGVVRSTLSYWKQRSYYAGLRRLPKIAFASTAEGTGSAARLYQSGCVTIGSTRYANFTSVTNSFYANAAAITRDAAYKSANTVMANRPQFLRALAEVVSPKDPESYARSLSSLISSYSLSDYDVVPIGLVLKSGSAGAKVTALQYLLKAAGNTTPITGRFDRATESAVSKFQAARKLKVDGEAGELTLSAVFAKLDTKSSGPRVSAANTLLGALGHSVPATGTFGNETLAAVKAFQTTAGQAVTGSIDKQTWAALFMTLDAAKPTVSGLAEVGQTMEAQAGTWGPGTVSISYQWYRGASAIAGATGAQYDVQPLDAGAALTVVVTGSRKGYTLTARASAATEVVRTANLKSTPTPIITGSPRVAETLGAIGGTWAPGPVSFAVQWFRGGNAIKGATSVRYTVGPADVGAKLTVAITGSKAGYTPVTKVSAATATVAKARLVSTPKPTITGTRRVGKTLTASHGGWGPGPVTYQYQWYRGSTPIKGAIRQTYKVRPEDRNRKVLVMVAGIKDGYERLVRKSAAARIG